MMENFRLRASVVKDQRGLVPLDLIKHGRDRIGGPTARPGRRLANLEHRNIGGRAGIGQKDVTGGVAMRQIARKGRRVFDRGRQADAPQAGAKRLKPRQRQHELITAFAFGEGVDFINHHAFQSGKNARRILVGHQQGKAFGGGQKDMRRVSTLAAFGMGRGITGAVLNPDGKAHVLDGSGQVALDVGGKRLERRDVKRVKPGMRALGQINQRWQETGQRLTPAGRRN